MSEVGDLYVVLRAVTEPFKRSIKEAAAEGEASSSRIGGALKKLAGIGVVAGGAALAIGGVSVKWAADFQTQMTRLNTAAGLSNDQLKAVHMTSSQLNDAVIKLGNQVGMTGTQMAEALYHPISAGLDLKSALEVTKYAAQEAQISGASLDDTTYSLSSVMKAFNFSASQAGPTMAALNAIVGEGDMRFQDLNGSIKNWAPTAAQMGISLTSMGSALGYLTDRGNSATEASTRLTMGLSMMTTPSAKATKMLVAMGVASTDVKSSSAAMEAAMKKAGITQNQLAMDLKKPDGIYVALNDLKTSLQKAGVSGTEADSVLSKIFGGGRSDKAIMSLMQNLDGLRDKYDKVTKDASGSKFADAWAKTQKTFQYQVHATESSLINMGIKLGTVLMPYVQTFLGWIQKGVGWLTQHKGAVLALAGALGTALVAAIAAVGGALVAAFGPEEAIALGIMAIGAALVYAYNHFKLFHDIVNTVARVIGQAFSVAWKVAAGVVHWFATTVMPIVQRAIDAVFKWFEAHKQVFIAAWNTLVQGAQQAVKWFNDNVLTWIRARLAELEAWWQQHGQQIEQVWHATWTVVGEALRLIWTGTIKPIIQTLLGFWQVTWGIIRDTVKIVWSAISGVVMTAIHLVMNIIGTVLDMITGKWGKVWGDLKHLVSQAFSDVVSTIWNVTKGFGTLLWNAGVNLIKGLINGAESMVSGVKNTLTSLTSKLTSWKGPPSKDKVLLEPAGRLLIEGLINGITGSTAHLRSELGHVTTKIGQWMREGLVHHKGVLADVMEKDDKRLLDLAARRDSVATRLKAAQKNLATVQKEWSAAQKQVADSIMQSSTVVMDASQNGGWLSSTQVLQNFQDQVTKTLQFAQYLKQAQANGLNGSMVQQIANAGVDSGFATAQALASASKGQIQQLNNMQKQMTGAANSVGNAAADSMYGAGLQAAKGLVKGLQSQESAIEKQMLKIAKAMGDAIKRALRIKSPSQVFADLGVFIPQGLAVGIEQGTHHATRAISTLGQRIAQSGRGLGVGTSGASASGQLPPIVVNVDGRQLFKIMQVQALRNNKNNPTNGLALA